MPRRISSQALWVLRQVVAVALGVFVYFRVRGLTVAKPAVAMDHANDVLAFEHRFGLDQEHHFQSFAHRVDVLVDVANWVYIWGHWPVLITVMVWLAIRHKDVFLRLRNAMFVSGGIGLVIFATYPVAPPRLTTHGYIDTVTQRSEAYRVLQPPAFVNPYAAMPSLHVGWDLLAGIAVFTAAGYTVLRAIACLMPVLMALAVVFTANHYVVDGFAGAALALFGLGVAVWYERVAAALASERLARLHVPHPHLPHPHLHLPHLHLPHQRRAEHDEAPAPEAASTTAVR